MSQLKLAASKIPIELMERLNRLTQLTGLTQSAIIRKAIEYYLDAELTGLSGLTAIEGNLKPSQLVTTDNPVNLRLTDIEARLAVLESRSVSTTVKPIAAVVTTPSPTSPIAAAVATKSNTTPKSKPNTTPKKANTKKAPTSPEPTSQPIAIVEGDALTTGEAWEKLYRSKLYKKQLAAFRTALRRARELDPEQLPDELVSIGVVADFETKRSAKDKDRTVRWLRIQ